MQYILNLILILKINISYITLILLYYFLPARLWKIVF